MYYSKLIDNAIYNVNATEFLCLQLNIELCSS
jgi:hypothetical protein